MGSDVEAGEVYGTALRESGCASISCAARAIGFVEMPMDGQGNGLIIREKTRVELR